MLLVEEATKKNDGTVRKILQRNKYVYRNEFRNEQNHIVIDMRILMPFHTLNYWTKYESLKALFFGENVSDIFPVFELRGLGWS